jgi:hypothetical protein
MGFRFYRRFKILPGIRLNFSRSGISTSVGVRGAHVTVGHGKVRETVGLPGSGISYTHVEGTHQEAQGEAQPAINTDTFSKGRAWRGWLWIAALVGIAVITAFLLTSCDEKPQTPSAVAPSITPPAPDPRAMYDLREKCGRDAQEWFLRFYGTDPAPIGGLAFTQDFKNHYNERLNRCYAVLSRTGMGMIAQHPGDKTKDLVQTLDKHLFEVNENNDMGRFFINTQSSAPLNCRIVDQQCASLKEWESLAAAYMEK